MKISHLRRRGTCILLGWLLLTAALLSACRDATSPGGTPDGNPDGTPPAVTEAPTEGALTLPDVTLPPEADYDPTAPDLPTAADLTEGAPYGGLIISSFYTPGRVAGEARVEAAYVELYNPAETPLSLAGVSLYVSDREGDFAEYRFPHGLTVPAKGYFLIRGREANGESDGVLSLDHTDHTFPTLCPDTGNTRLALAPAGMTLPAHGPMATVEGLFTYVSTSPADREDTYHYQGGLSADEVIRKKATTSLMDYQSVNLTRAATDVLSQIRPRTAAGDVNTTVRTLVDEVTFSHESGVYTEGFDLSLSAPEGYKIYFSINSNDPKPSPESAYATPLHLTDTTAMTWGRLTTWLVTHMGKPYTPTTATFPGAAVIRAYAVRESDGAITPTAVRTYFIGKDYGEWDVDMVSMTLHSEDFLGTRGIYNTLRTDKDGGHSHAPAYVEFFSPEGEGVYAGWSEIAMNGRGSLGMPQKSVRILLKSTVMDTPVGENLSVLNYDLYGEYAATAVTGERLTWHRHILLRNGGGDMSGSTISRSHIGDAFVQRLDRFLIPDVMSYAPVMLFVNGEFFGLFNARDRLDPKYFACKYGVPEEDFALLECPYPLTFGWNVDYTTANGDPDEALYFMDLVNFCMENDMSLRENYDYIAERMDLDGLIDQYCAQIYLCCSDWPSNNIKIWRNTNPDNPYVDTRWHFTIVDTDHGVGLNSNVDTNLWGVINDGPVLSRVVNHLMENKDFRERFLARYIWCVEVYFNPDRMQEELDTLLSPILPVMQLQLDRWRRTDGVATDWEDWQYHIGVIEDFIQNRKPYAKSQFMAWAGLTDGQYRYYYLQAVELWGDESPLGNGEA